MNDSPDPQHTVVIIEDEADIRALLVEAFESAGFRTVPVDNGIDGVEAVRAHQPMVTTLDVSMPGIDGFEVARRIRTHSTTYIIMLSALGTEADIVLGLNAGADDYVVKPFRQREMRARIEAMRRRPRLGSGAPAEAVVGGSSVDEDSLTHHDLQVNPATRTVTVADREIELTRTEFDLLATLVESRRRVRSKSDLTLVLHGEDPSASFYVSEADKRAVETHMANLRRKLSDNPIEPRYIETVRGVGYRMTP